MKTEKSLFDLEKDDMVWTKTDLVKVIAIGFDHVIVDNKVNEYVIKREEIESYL